VEPEPAVAAGEGDGTCPAGPGQCSGASTWTPLEEFEEDAASFLNCESDGTPRSVVAYCVSTRPPESDCVLEAPAPEGKAGSVEYLEWRKGCLHRCIFSQPDLNLVDVSEEGVALLSPLSATGYKATPFLDQRSTDHGVESCRYVVPMKQLQELTMWGSERKANVGGRPVGEGVHFIFHLGHTGSTLLTRALAEVEDTLVLREPPLLSWMAETFTKASAKQISALWQSPILPVLSRRHSKDQTVVVKAKSAALRFLRPALRSTESSKAVFMYSSLRTHLTVVLAREQERFPDEQYEALEVKAKVFQSYALSSSAFKDLSVPRRMALAWMKRMLFVMSTNKRSRILQLNMEDFLADPRRHLLEVAAFFGLPLEKREANSIVSNSGVFGVYAKDTSLEWGDTMQRRLMAGRASMFKEGVEDGLDFAKALLAKHKSLQRLEGLLGE